MVDEGAAAGVILLLTLVTITTRVGGLVIMSFVEITPWLRRFLRYMATSVLISIVVPATLSGPPRLWVAVGASATAMLGTGNALAAMLIGAAIAAAGRAFGL